MSRTPSSVTDADVRAAALQYVRKISGFRAPAAHNAPAFDEAVAAIAAATQHLLDHLEVRGAPRGTDPAGNLALGMARRQHEGPT